MLLKIHSVIKCVFDKKNELVLLPSRRWFSIQNSQLVYQKKLKVLQSFFNYHNVMEDI